MATYDFTKQPNRFVTHSIKWRESEQARELLPLWIADMDFFIADEIKTALKDYTLSDDYGYAYASDALYQSIIDWEKNVHDHEVARDEIVLIEGVVPAISTAIQAFTQENDAVMINTPVYPPFARSVLLNDRKLVRSSLLEVDGRFVLDFEKIEQDIIKHKVKLYLLCSPHNPGGRVWSFEDLKKLGALCQKHEVLLVSDEIHQDLTLYGNQHHSFNTVDSSFKDFTIILSSATKTFNIAGTKNSFAIIANSKLRQQFKRKQLANNQHEVATIGLVATQAAYTYGSRWLAELKPVLETNIDYVCTFFEKNTQIKVMKPEATYLVWLDFSAYGLSESELHDLLRDKAKVLLNKGLDFGQEGKQHARLNIAAPFTVIETACQRIAKALSDL